MTVRIIVNVVVLSTALLVGCSSEPEGIEVPFYSDRPLWSEVDLDRAEDLGHDPVRTGGGAPGVLAFEDVTVAAGLGGVRGGGNQHGVGLGLVDLDGDAAPDLVLANGVSNVTGASWPSVLFWNDGTGGFTDGSGPSGFGAALEGLDTYSVSAGDVDNDGDVDLYVGAQPTNVLLLNEGDRRFVDATVARGAGGPPSDAGAVGSGSGKVVSMGDVDGDGWLDLVSASSTHDAPGAAFLRNRGDGTFEDATAGSGITIHPRGNPCAVMFSDYDNDADPDLWIWNDRGGHVLLRNEGGRFRDLGEAPAGLSIGNPMGIDGADVDRDGDLDYYVSNIGRHPLLVNQGDGRFVDATDGAGTTGDYGWGLGFEDFDLDGWPDLFVTQEDDRPVLAYRNLGATAGSVAFQRVDVPRPVLVADRRASHNVAAAFGDVDGDGRTDAAWATTDGSRMVLHRNVTDAAGQRGLEVRVGGGGVGARVAVGLADGTVVFRDVVAGASRASVSDLAVRVGLGDWDGAAWVAVYWQNGTQRAFTRVPAGRLIVGAAGE